MKAGRRVRALHALAMIACAAVAPAAGADVRITNDDTAGSYRRYDGATDATTRACSTGRREQVEPTVAVDPHDPAVVAAGSFEFCNAMTAPAAAGGGWMGLHRSTDGGATWRSQLVPGYPADSSPAGRSAPFRPWCQFTGDPVQAFSRTGRLYFGFQCLDRLAADPTNPSTLRQYVATYARDGSRYLRTVRVPDLLPDAIAHPPLLEDKPAIAVDRTGGRRDGTVYYARSQLPVSGVDTGLIIVSRSTDDGRSFSSAVPVLPGVLPPAVGAALDVGPDGTVYLAFRTFGFPTGLLDFIWLARSTDGARTFTPPALVARIDPFDSSRFSGDPLGPLGSARCGDGPYRCASGQSVARGAVFPSVAADRRGVHVAYSAIVRGGGSRVFVRSSPDGLQWTAPARMVAPAPRGHQWFPAIASDGTTLTVVFNDSRIDAGYAPDRFPGNTAAGTNSGAAREAYAARSSDGGSSWSEQRLSTTPDNPLMHTAARSYLRYPVDGDYLSVAAAGGRTFAVWTDSRDVVAGSDTRAGNRLDGFEVYAPCVWVPATIDAAQYSLPRLDDPCLSQGGLDRNIYGAPVP